MGQASVRLESLWLSVKTFIKHSLLVLVVVKLTGGKGPQKASIGQNPRILIVRRDGLGDFILTTPFLRELRRNFRASHITLLAGSNVKDLALMCPYLDSVETLDHRPLKVSRLLDVIKFVRANLYAKFDLALLPRWDADMNWSTLIACLSGAPRIVAYTRGTSALKTRVNWGYDSLVTDALPCGDLPHEMDRTLALVTHLGGTVKSRAMELWWNAADQREAERFLDEEGANTRPRPWIALGVGATEKRKLWPYFGALLSQMRQKTHFTPFIFVTPGELESANELKDAMPACVIVCQPIRVAAVILNRCDIFVGNDSGPLHVAVAAGLPTVEICCHPLDGDPADQYSPARFGHVGENGRAVQPISGLDNCSATCVEDSPHCISMVTPEQVMAAIDSLIGVPA